MKTKRASTLPAQISPDTLCHPRDKPEKVKNRHGVPSLQAMKTVPGYLEVKNINSLGGTLDNVLSYLDATDQKYGCQIAAERPA
jgi:hypothetical protein